MIVVFVIDTSPSMRKPLSKKSESGQGMSRLDLAKMAVEDMVRGLNKRVSEHNNYLHQHPEKHNSLRNIGLGFNPNDQFLLLSTGRQHSQQPATAACGGGGRLLVGYGDLSHDQAPDNPSDHPTHHLSNADSFQKELKCLQATDWEHGKIGPNNMPVPFPEDGGGIVGLNIALSVGLQMLSRYRLMFRSTENYGMGRLPSPAVLSPTGGGPAVHALQPACLILITDGACLRSSPKEGGGSLQLQYGKMPLREFYQEPFRWDQRIFCLGVGGSDGVDSTQFFHPHLRALCEVTGGSHMMLRSSATLAQSTIELLRKIAPPRPSDLPIPDPLKLQSTHSPLVGSTGTFVSGGPVCSFQALEGGLDTGQVPPKHRALLLYVPHQLATSDEDHADAAFLPPTWCIPESFFPNKTLDTLPPRSAQPNLLFSRFPARLGSKSFEPGHVLNALSRLDQLMLSNRKHFASGGNPTKLLQRDVYVCEWISTDGKVAKGPQSPISMDYFPVVVPGGARQVGEGELSHLNIGILHIPSGTSAMGHSLQSGVRISTLTLLPPEPHLLLPLLIRAAEAEHRVMALETKDVIGAPSAGILKKQALASRNVHLDENWKNEFRAYLFRIPPYYQNALRRTLRSVLPASVHSLLNADGSEGALVSQCFSKNCLQKIRNAEQIAKESIDRLERQETELRRRGPHPMDSTRSDPQPQVANQRRFQSDKSNERAKTPLVGYGQYDPRSNPDSYLAGLKGLPAPWRVGAAGKTSEPDTGDSLRTKSKSGHAVYNAAQALGDLPGSCLMAYYESRRRWIFGGSSLTTRGLFVEGASNDGSNVQQCGATHDVMEDSLLSFAGVGVSQMNATTTAKMGDYRERLLWSRAPVVGNGSNDSFGVSATTAVDGGPKWSVDDDAMPMTFFNQQTGEFMDSVQARVRSRLMVNFGNPYKDRRADSLIPEDFRMQSPSSKKGLIDRTDGGSLTPPGSPPHDSFSATEGEGEAVFANPPPKIRKSPSRSDAEDKFTLPKATRQKTGHDGPRISKSSSSDSSLADPTINDPAVQSSGQKSPKVPVVPGSNRQPPRPPPKAPQAMARIRPPGPPAPPPRAPPPPSGLPKKPPVPERPPAPPASASTKPPDPPRLPHQDDTHNLPTGTESQAGAALLAITMPVGTGASTPVADPVELENAGKKPEVDLPAGWMTVWSKSQKRWYFFCTKTNKSVWEWPPPRETIY
jgi:hypothetical protein